MNIGDKLDPVAIGHTAIDIKGLLIEAGYVMPQGSIAKLPRLPGEVEARITEMKAAQEKFETLDETKAFHCAHCSTNNSGAWRKETATGQEFLVCGECHTVTEVR